MGRKKYFLPRVILCFFLSFLALVSFPAASFALTASQRLIYGQNNLVFYNPDEALCQPVQNGSSSSDTAAPSSGNSRLEWAVESFGMYAMEMQKEFGTPWEVVIAQMNKESSVGTAGVAVSGADNNWLGITGSGDAGSYASGNHKFAIFSSVNKSIEAWAGWKVLRNGYYDKALAYLDPSNYDLKNFLTTMIHTYAPSSDGNDEEKYVKDVLSDIEGPIKKKRTELGWPTSEELAKKENIPIGGRHPIGSSAEDAATSQQTPTSEVCSSDGKTIDGKNGQAIANLAILLAWPDQDHYNVVKDEFAEYARKVGEDPSLAWSQDCGHFASVVIRNTVDPDFPRTYTGNMLEYFKNHGDKWEQIENHGDTSTFQPGDILINIEHIYIYTGKNETNQYDAAGASQGTKTGHAHNVYFSNTPWQVYRFKGGN